MYDNDQNDGIQQGLGSSIGRDANSEYTRGYEFESGDRFFFCCFFFLTFHFLH